MEADSREPRPESDPDAGAPVSVFGSGQAGARAGWFRRMPSHSGTSVAQTSAVGAVAVPLGATSADLTVQRYASVAVATTATRLPAAREWIVAFSLAIALGAGIAIASGTTSVVPWPAAAAALGILATYTVFIVIALPRFLGRPVGALTIVAMVVTVIVVAALTLLAPWLAMLQFWMYPLLWKLAPSTRVALGMSFVAAGAVLAALLRWNNPQEWAVTMLVQAVSFAASMVLGLWFRTIARYGAERAALLSTLTRAQTKLAVLHREAGVRAERDRLAAEMHATIARSLAGTVTLIRRARQEHSVGTLDGATLALAEDAAGSALDETRMLVAGGVPAGAPTDGEGDDPTRGDGAP